MTSDKVQKIPVGAEFLQLLEDLENDCLAGTTKRLSELGKVAPQTLEHLGTVLSLLDRLASCHWGCNGGDHIAEYLAGRCCSSSRASFRLIRHGYYDESLALTRSIAETANLLFLFWRQPTSFEQWKKADKSARLREFGPAAVRKRLEAANVPLPADTTRYSEFCEIATHVTPATKPQAHNPLQVPTLGGYFQAGGYLMALNELSGMIAMATFASSRLVRLDQPIAKQIAAASVELLRNTGGIDILSIRQALDQSKNNKEGTSAA